MAGPVKGWTPTNADSSHIKFEGQQPHYILQEGNTPHHVAVMINEMNPELGDVATIRGNIVKYNGFDTDPKHKTDPSYNEKSVYRLQIGQEIGLPTEYATALAAFNTAHPADAVTMGGDVPAPEAPVEAAPLPPAAPAPEAQQAAADLGAVVGGGAEAKAAPKEKKVGSGLFGKFEGMLAGMKAKHEAKQTQRINDATAERKAETVHTAAQNQALAEYKATIATQPKYAEVVAYIEQHSGHRQAKVLAKAEEMVSDIDQKESKATAKTAATEQQRAAEAAQTAADTAALNEVYLRVLHDPEARYPEVVQYIVDNPEAKTPPGKTVKHASEMMTAIDQRIAKDEKREAMVAARGVVRDTRRGELAPEVVINGAADIRQADALADAAAAPTIVASNTPTE